MNVSDLLVFFLSGAICLRLIFYSRNGAKFKPHISLVAWLVITGTGSLALSLATGNLKAHDLHPVLIILIGGVAPIIFFARGNIARLFRPSVTSLPARKHRHL